MPKGEESISITGATGTTTTASFQLSVRMMPPITRMSTRFWSMGISPSSRIAGMTAVSIRTRNVASDGPFSSWYESERRSTWPNSRVRKPNTRFSLVRTRNRPLTK